MCDCDPTIKTPKCGVGICKWPEDVLLKPDPPKPGCGSNMHIWAPENQDGAYCMCGKVYQPKKPYAERIAVKEGETREFPEGFKVTFPIAGFWEVTVLPQESATNSKAAIMVMRL